MSDSAMLLPHLEAYDLERLPKWDDIDLVDARILAKDNLYWLAKEVLRYEDLYAPLHGLVCRFLEEFREGHKEVANLELARGHYKTTLASISFAIFLLLHDQDDRILIVHGKRDTAMGMLKEIKHHLEHNDRLKALFPDIFYETPVSESDTWLQDRLTVRRTDKAAKDRVPSIMATGVDASVVGLHFDWIFHDDLVFQENVNTAEAREKTRDYRRLSFPLFKGGGKRKLLNTGTRWHFDDSHQELEDGADDAGAYAGMVTQLKLGCRDESGDPLFRTMWTNEKLDKERQRMGSYAFAGQFENSPIPRGEGYFKRKNILWFDELPGWTTIEPRPGDPPRRPYKFFTAVDPNRSEKTMADWCVVTTAARDELGHIWVVDMTRSHPTGMELINIIADHMGRWNPEKVIVESNNYQLQLVRWLEQDQLKRGRVWPIQSVVRHSGTRKVERIGALQPLVERGALHLFSTGMEAIALELEQWPESKHDDTLDTLADIWAYGTNPIPNKASQAPTNVHTMQSIMDGIRQQNKANQTIRFGRRGPDPSTSGWLYR